MDELADDDKKVFDVDGANEDDSQPDPDEQLMLDQGNGRVWLVKIPKHLMERWASIDAEDVHLATLRIYNSAVGPSGKKPRIVLFLPPVLPSPNEPLASTPPNPSHPVFHPNPSITAHRQPDELDAYELEMVNDSVDNQIVVAERPKDPHPLAGVNSRARTTILTGRIKHECSLRPVMSELYRRQMRERSRKYNTPTRQIRMIEDAGVPGGRGGVNRLSSGVAVGTGFGPHISSKQKPAKGTFERMARMPRNQLLDMIFGLFQNQPRWGIKLMREKTQQPEAYLKEVLGEVAILHRHGEYNGLWELKEVYKGDGVKRDIYSVGPSSGVYGDVKMEDADEEEDEDEDMEEVS